MKYVNAHNVLPEELILMIQKHYQAGYLYIPGKKDHTPGQQTDYKIELSKRNQYIYLKHLEGWTNGQLRNIFHLSESSIRRIIFKERTKHQKMKTTIEEILPLWELENEQLIQIYSSAWELNHSYVIKMYDDRKQLERNIQISTILSACNIPVAEIVPVKTGEKYAAHNNVYFLVSKKLPGSNITEIKNPAMSYKMGRAIAQLHKAFIECEKEIEFWDNSLLQEMKGWVRKNLANHAWQIIEKEDYDKTVELLENIYDCLPKQLIHRDVHFGNFLFCEGELSGYIDFDLSQKNIRIFDICYFLTGLLAEETDNAFTQNEWIESFRSAVAGYESIIRLSAEEKRAFPCVMKCIEILCAAYFIGLKDRKHAYDAYHVFRFIQSCENDITDI